MQFEFENIFSLFSALEGLHAWSFFQRLGMPWNFLPCPKVKNTVQQHQLHTAYFIQLHTAYCILHTAYCINVMMSMSMEHLNRWFDYITVHLPDHEWRVRGGSVMYYRFLQDLQVCHPKFIDDSGNICRTSLPARSLGELVTPRRLGKNLAKLFWRYGST